MKSIWIIEDYSAMNEGEFVYYGFCKTKEDADKKAAQLNLAAYNNQKKFSSNCKPEWSEHYHVEKLDLIED